jgi:hypothetical protein
MVKSAAKVYPLTRVIWAKSAEVQENKQLARKIVVHGMQKSA